MDQDTLFEWEEEDNTSSSPLDPIQQALLDWNEQPITPPTKHENPCINLYGKGPEGKQCGDCEHLIRDHHHGAIYPKCELRKLTRGPGSDHRVRWPTCGKFEQRIEQDGDILVEGQREFLVHVWKRGYWRYYGGWTLADLAKACEEQDLVLIKHIPEDSTYEGIYRKRGETSTKKGNHNA